MRVLLDTHTVFWALRRPSQLSAGARHLLDDGATEVVVSAVTPWELSIKHASGKMPTAGPVLADWPACRDALRAEALTITDRHALVAGSLAGPHRDPFDRMLAAQALIEELPLVSADQVFDAIDGVRRLWD